MDLMIQAAWKRCPQGVRATGGEKLHVESEAERPSLASWRAETMAEADRRVVEQRNDGSVGRGSKQIEHGKNVSANETKGFALIDVIFSDVP